MALSVRMVGVLLCFAALVPARASELVCRIPGHAIQWIADYCMLRLETDDVIAASECIEAERRRRPRDTCAVKTRYKTEFCRLALERGAAKGSLHACVADRGFKGKSVAEGG